MAHRSGCSAASFVNTFRGKDANAVVTNCPADASPGDKCVAWVAFAAQKRLKADGTVTKTASLELTKFRVTITRSGFRANPVADGVVDDVKLAVADDLSSATASGVVPVKQCDKKGQNCTITNVTVSFSLTANAPADFNRGRVVTKMGSCRIVDRFNARTRPADGTATINGTSLPTTPAVPSSIDSSTDTLVFRHC